MRRVIAMVSMVALVMTIGSRVRAEEKGDARATIDRAIKATGGEEKIKKFRAMTWKEKGTFYGMGDGVAYTGIYSHQYPNQFRMEIENVFVIVVNGDKGWSQMGGNTTEMTKDQLAEQKENMYADSVARLTPLSDKAYKLAALPEIKVNGRAAVGVKVSHKGHRDVKLYFDGESGLLVQREQTVKDDQSGKEVTQVATFSDFKAVEGIKVPTKTVIMRDGKKFVEAEEHDVKLLEKLDDSTFDKP